MKKSADYIKQIIPAQPGYYVRFKHEDGPPSFDPVVAWAVCDEVIIDEIASNVVPLSLCCEGYVEDVTSVLNYSGVYYMPEGIPKLP